MINSSPEAAATMTAKRRYIKPVAVMDLIDPDIIYMEPTTNGHNAYSKLTQLYDKVMDSAPKYATLELNRWTLNGTFDVLPDSVGAATGNIGYIGLQLSGADGTFAEPHPWVQLNMSSVDIIQAAGVAFTGIAEDGYGVDIVFDVYSGASIVHTQTIIGNEERQVGIEGFTVHYPTAIRVTFLRWSLPSRYPRSVEIIPNIYEEWYGSTIYSLDVMEETDFTSLRLPYETATLEIYNKNRRFDPRNKSGLFKSIEERQGVPLYFDVELPDKTFERIPRGVFYQQTGGWERIKNGLLMRFKLVSIIGLLATRRFIPPASLPTTVSGWIQAIVSQLGTNFSDSYIVDDSIASKSLTCTAADVDNITCGDLLRFVCMAVAAYPRMDVETGKLLVAPPPSSGGVALTLKNMNAVPDAKANDDIANITFKLGDGNNTLYTIGGTSSASSKTLSIGNFFIKSSAQAVAAARNILYHYDGQRYEATGRGDVRSELGDIDIIELGLGAVSGGRRIKQQLKMTDGKLKNALSHLIQATGESGYSSANVLRQSGTWTAPEGVTKLRLVLVGGGAGGTNGASGENGQSGGYFGGRGKNGENGTPGVGGKGGKIFTAEMSINPGQIFTYEIGEGGAAGSPGGDTQFAMFSSASGTVYDGWVDVVSGDAFGRTGANGTQATTATPINGADAQPNTGNGGGGGSGGIGGQGGEPAALSGGSTGTIISDPTPGTPGTRGGAGGKGGSGAVIISYDLEDSAT